MDESFTFDTMALALKKTVTAYHRTKDGRAIRSTLGHREGEGFGNCSSQVANLTKNASNRQKLFCRGSSSEPLFPTCKCKSLLSVSGFSAGSSARLGQSSGFYGYVSMERQITLQTECRKNGFVKSVSSCKSKTATFPEAIHGTICLTSFYFSSILSSHLWICRFLNIIEKTKKPKTKTVTPYDKIVCFLMEKLG